MWYDIDYVKFIIQLLPPVLRQPRLLSLFKLLSIPFRDQIDDNKAFYNTRLNKLNVNGRVIYMERELNNLFYTDKIYITDNIERTYVNVYLDTDEPLYLEDDVTEESVCLYDEMQSISADFIVNIPQTLAGDILEVENYVKYYKPAGKAFIIKIYNENITDRTVWIG